MARITFVKKAQQRYKTVPVIDPATGQQKVTPVLRKDGSPKMTRAKANRPARAITMKVTEADKNQPLPLLTCDFSGCKHSDRKIQIGTPYKHITPKSGPYGGRQRNRHADCPSWQVWEYSSSLSARLAEVSHSFRESLGTPESADDVTSALAEAAEAVREIAAEKQEGADNIESGFGHSTSQSEELADTAQQLESWADEIEGAEVPDYPEPEETDCDECDGSGEVIDPDSDEEASTTDETPKIECEQCEGVGQYTPDEPTDDQIAEWLEAVEDACNIVDESPV